MTKAEPNVEQLMLVDEPEFGRVMECVFGIHEHEHRTYSALAEVPGSTVAELAKDLHRDRSSINRSLSTLEEKGLVERDRKLLEGGGYVYQYFALPVQEIRRRMHIAVEVWSSQVHDRIDEFGQ